MKTFLLMGKLQSGVRAARRAGGRRARAADVRAAPAQQGSVGRGGRRAGRRSLLRLEGEVALRAVARALFLRLGGGQDPDLVDLPALVQRVVHREFLVDQRRGPHQAVVGVEDAGTRREPGRPVVHGHQGRLHHHHRAAQGLGGEVALHGLRVGRGGGREGEHQRGARCQEGGEGGTAAVHGMCPEAVGEGERNRRPGGFRRCRLSHADRGAQWPDTMNNRPSRPHHRWLLALCLGLLPFLSACFTAPPQGVTVVSPFDVKRYSGRWYEIARLDHGFERGLSEVNATYRLESDGSVAVLNRGFDAAKGEWNPCTLR
eukprot:Opistho-1_new@19593